jgi:hypothetical protein
MMILSTNSKNSNYQANTIKLPDYAPIVNAEESRIALQMNYFAGSRRHGASVFFVFYRTD